MSRATSYVITDEGRQCSGCKEQKNWSEFYRHKGGINGYMPKCKECWRDCVKDYEERKNKPPCTCDCCDHKVRR